MNCQRGRSCRDEKCPNKLYFLPKMAKVVTFYIMGSQSIHVYHPQYEDFEMPLNGTLARGVDEIRYITMYRRTFSEHPTKVRWKSRILC
jgi:hypothetical protein